MRRLNEIKDYPGLLFAIGASCAVLSTNFPNYSNLFLGVGVIVGILSISVYLSRVKKLNASSNEVSITSPKPIIIPSRYFASAYARTRELEASDVQLEVLWHIRKRLEEQNRALELYRLELDRVMQEAIEIEPMAFESKAFHAHKKPKLQNKKKEHLFEDKEHLFEDEFCPAS